MSQLLAYVDATTGHPGVEPEGRAAANAVRSNAPLDALHGLRDTQDGFLRLALRPPASEPLLLHAVVAHLHQMGMAVATCEAAGLTRAEIYPCLEPLRDILAESPFIRRLQTWPRGYAGDFETVEWICDADNRAPVATVAWASEQYALQAPIAQQHRNKVALQARTTLSLVAANPDARVASIGCGGCRDLSMIQEFLGPGAGRFVLVDADGDALDLARRRLARIADRCTFISGRIPQVLPTIGREGPFHLVVAGGLFDYLPDRVAIATLRALRRALVPRGRVLFSNIASGNPFRHLIEYLADWRLIERDEHDLRRLVAEAGFDPLALHTYRDSSGLAVLADVRSEGGLL